MFTTCHFFRLWHTCLWHEDWFSIHQLLAEQKLSRRCVITVHVVTEFSCTMKKNDIILNSFSSKKVQIASGVHIFNMFSRQKAIIFSFQHTDKKSGLAISILMFNPAGTSLGCHSFLGGTCYLISGTHLTICETCLNFLPLLCFLYFCFTCTAPVVQYGAGLCKHSF
jgi:hypothetical protein